MTQGIFPFERVKISEMSTIPYHHPILQVVSSKQENLAENRFSKTVNEWKSVRQLYFINLRASDDLAVRIQISKD